MADYTIADLHERQRAYVKLVMGRELRPDLRENMLYACEQLGITLPPTITPAMLSPENLADLLLKTSDPDLPVDHLPFISLDKAKLRSLGGELPLDAIREAANFMSIDVRTRNPVEKRVDPAIRAFLDDELRGLGCESRIDWGAVFFSKTDNASQWLSLLTQALDRGELHALGRVLETRFPALLEELLFTGGGIKELLLGLPAREVTRAPDLVERVHRE